MNRRTLLLIGVLHLVATIAHGQSVAGVHNVRDHGAVADGTTLCTAALQRAIDRCAAAGGGTVYFPAGTYLTGTLELRSHVTLHLDAGATLKGSTNPTDYPARPVVLPSYTDNYVRQALIAGENLEHIGLRGSGTIDGSGAAFKWKEYRDQPFGIRLVNCKDVTVEGLTLRDAAMWMQYYLGCERVRIHGVRVFSHVSYNNDGLDIDGCRDVAVSDCVIDSDDDAIVLKSTLPRPCENVTVTNCVLSSHANAFKLGTESNGGFRNITFSNSVILSPRYSQGIYGSQRGSGGIALETVDGGRLENVLVSNVSIDGVSVALFLRLGDRARPHVADAPRPPVGSFRNVRLENIVATRTGRIGCSITGVPGATVEEVTLANITLEFDGGGRRVEKAVPEQEAEYPRVNMFGELPAYGIYARHVRGFTLSGIRLHTLTPDARHAIVCEDVRDLDVGGLSVPATAAGGAAVMRFTEVQHARVRGFASRGPVDAFLQLEGSDTHGITLIGNDFSNVHTVAERGAGVAGDALRDVGSVNQ